MSVPHTTIDEFTLPLRIVIRPCTEADLPNLEWYGAFHLQRSLIQRAFERHLAGENPMLVAVARGYPVGQVWVDLKRKETELVGVLWALRVLPSLRGMGIGSRLVSAAEIILVENGFETAEVVAEKDDPYVRHLYEHLGYHCVGKEAGELDHASPGSCVADARVDQWLLRKSLVPAAPERPIPIAIREPGFIGVDTVGPLD